jgi:hypothetical protein
VLLAAACSAVGWLYTRRLFIRAVLHVQTEKHRFRFPRVARRRSSTPNRFSPRLRAEGYLISPSYEGADLVVVNTCGFIDAAVEESLDAIGEALTANGKVIVTGCLGSTRRSDPPGAPAGAGGDRPACRR